MIAARSMVKPKIRQRARRARHWALAPLAQGEAAAVALVGVGIIIAFGLLGHRELTPILGIAFLVGAGIRTVGFCCATRTR